MKQDEQIKILKEALMIAKAQLEGVVLGLQTHGNNISVPFWIEHYSFCAKEADRALAVLRKGS